MTPAPRRAALLVGPLGQGGIGTVVLDHCARFAALGLTVELLLDARPSPFTARLPASARRVTLPSLHPLWGVPGLVRYLRQARPDCIVVHRPRLLRPLRLAMRLGRVRPRLVGVIHARLGSKQRRLAADLAACAALLAPSGAIARATERWLNLPEGRIGVAYPTLSVPELQARAADSPEAPGLAAPPDHYLIAVARLEPEKDLPTLLAAFARLAPLQPELELVILGDGTQRQALLRESERLGIAARTRFAGFAVNPYPWIRGARLLALSSLQETFGLVLAEALALGVPVVATDVDGPAEILAGGRHGRLVPPRDPAALADAIAATLAAPPPADLLAAAVAPFSPERTLPVHQRALGLAPADGTS